MLLSRDIEHWPSDLFNHFNLFDLFKYSKCHQLVYPFRILLELLICLKSTFSKWSFFYFVRNSINLLIKHNQDCSVLS